MSRGAWGQRFRVAEIPGTRTCRLRRGRDQRASPARSNARTRTSGPRTRLSRKAEPPLRAGFVHRPLPEESQVVPQHKERSEHRNHVARRPPELTAPSSILVGRACQNPLPARPEDVPAPLPPPDMPEVAFPTHELRREVHRDDQAQEVGHQGKGAALRRNQQPSGNFRQNQQPRAPFRREPRSSL